MKSIQISIKSLITTISSNSLLIGLMLGSSYALAQDFYKWVDENGSTHYTTTPSPKGVKRFNKVSTYPDQPFKDQLSAQRQAYDEANRSIEETISAVESATRAAEIASREAENAARKQMLSEPAASAYPYKKHKRK